MTAVDADSAGLMQRAVCLGVMVDFMVCWQWYAWQMIHINLARHLNLWQLLGPGQLQLTHQAAAAS